MPQWISWVADIFSILAFLAAVYAGLQSRKSNRDREREKQRQAKVVRVVLNNGPRAIEPPGILRRSEFNRAEILGRVGMIPMKVKGKRFEINYLNTAEFIRRTNEISDAQGDSILTIPITDEEYNQFDMEQFRKQTG